MIRGFAFVNAETVVVQAISGDLNAAQLATFEHDYAILFGAEFSVPVVDDAIVWIGGSYDPATGTFSPPPQPEVVVEEPAP